jgi:hypothetical protein
MKDNVKNIVVTICFFIITSGFMMANLIMPDAELSFSERRRLAAAPVFSLEKLFNGELFKEFEDYSLDQFVFRDLFRGFKAVGSLYVFNQKDNNNIYIVDGSINKVEYPLNEKSIFNAADKLNEVYRKYLQGKNVNYAVIPDKNYFVASKKGYLSLDYDKLLEIMHENVDNMKYIDLFSALTIADYYRTDIHWSQDKIIKAADKLLKEMGNSVRASDVQYTKKELYPFYGSYYGQAALNVTPDTLVYLTSSIIDKAVVYDHQSKKYSTVYNMDKFGGIDSYDVFLDGAKPLITVNNPEVDKGKELILFRDSFGSSIAPLLLQGYSKITLVDLRYITTDLLGDFIDFSKDQDVLFLYSTQVLNNSYMLR